MDLGADNRVAFKTHDMRCIHFYLESSSE